MAETRHKMPMSPLIGDGRPRPEWLRYLAGIERIGETDIELNFLTEATTLYVATTGDDTAGNGSSSAPFLTVTKAVTVASRYILNGNTLIIRVADGDYGGELVLIDDGPLLIGIGGGYNIEFLGNSDAPENVTGLVFSINGGTYSFGGFTLSSVTVFDGKVFLESIRWVEDSGYHIQAYPGTHVEEIGDVVIVGDVLYHIKAHPTAYAEFFPESLTLVDTPDWTDAFVVCEGGFVEATDWSDGITVTGTATGDLLHVSKNGYVATGGNDFPGNGAEVDATGGLHD